MYFSLSPFEPDKLVSRNRFGRPVPRQPAHQANTAAADSNAPARPSQHAKDWSQGMRGEGQDRGEWRTDEEVQGNQREVSGLTRWRMAVINE